MEATNENAAIPDQGMTTAKRSSNTNSIAYAPSLAKQRAMILAALRAAASNGRTTIDLRHRTGVMHPAARVMELRQSGYEIQTRWDQDRTPDGVSHRVARYVLVKEAGGAA